MSKPNPYINTLYLAFHFAINVLVVVLVVDIIDAFVPIKHFFTGYHINVHNINLHAIYPPTTLEKNLIAAAFAMGIAYWYYQKKKAKANENGSFFKYHLPNLHFPNLRELEEYIKSKF